MAKASLVLMALASLTACADYQGRKTNCWSPAPTTSGSMSFMQSEPGAVSCTDWIVISG